MLDFENANAGQELAVDILDNNSLTVRSGDRKKSFNCSFDSVLGASSTQQDVYKIVKHCTDSVLEGFNRFVKMRVQVMC